MSLSSPKILVIDDDFSLGRVIYYELRERGFSVETARSGEAGLELFNRQSFDAVLTDLRMKGIAGMEVLKTVLQNDPNAIVIIMTAFGTMDDAMKAVRFGAADYITKPFATDQLAFVIEKALRIKRLEQSAINLRQQVMKQTRFENLIGASQPMQTVYKMAQKVALSDAPVLVLGETGTGKEELAKAIHNNGLRSDGPFVPVNCGSIPEHLIESELFGHEKGAFTGAIRRHSGSFEQADNGTIFLDEVAELPLLIQVKLLRVLQEHEIQRLGSENRIYLNLRVTAATNQDLNQMVADGVFREDLYYRLNVVNITLPPLRERGSDIDLLADHFLNEFDKSHQLRFTEEVYERFRTYDFPGNVRELQNAVQRAVVMAEKETITLQDLPPKIRTSLSGQTTQPVNLSQMTLDEVERLAIRQALEQTNGNQTQAANRLGIPRHVLLYRLKKYGIDFF